MSYPFPANRASGPGGSEPESFGAGPFSAGAPPSRNPSSNPQEAAMKNVGGVDRILRLLLGLGLLSLVFVGPKTPWGWIGVVPLLTSLVSFCPLYTLLGVRTCARQKDSRLPG